MIEINLFRNEIVREDMFQHDNLATTIRIDFTNCDVNDWNKYLDIETADGNNFRVDLGKDIVVEYEITNMITRRGELKINPMALKLDGKGVKPLAQKGFKTFVVNVQDTVNSYGEGSENYDDMVLPLIADVARLSDIVDNYTKKTEILEGVSQEHSDSIIDLNQRTISLSNRCDELKENIDKNQRLTDAEIGGIKADLIAINKSLDNHKILIDKNTEGIKDLVTSTTTKFGLIDADITSLKNTDAKHSKDIVDLQTENAKQSADISANKVEANNKFASMNVSIYDLEQEDILIKGNISAIQKEIDKLLAHMELQDALNGRFLNNIANLNARIDNIVDVSLVNIERKIATNSDEIEQGFDNRYTKQEVDDELNTKADKLDTYTKTEVDTKLSEKVQNFKIKNEVENGDFSDGTSGFDSNGNSIDLKVENGYFSFVSKTTTWSGGVSFSVPNYENAKYYMLLKDQNVGAIYVNNTSLELKGKIEVSGDFSSIFQAESTFNTRVNIYGRGADLENKIKSIHLLNLTQTFGAGNEPTKEQMDELMKIVPNGWWDGELTLEQKEVVQWLLKLEAGLDTRVRTLEENPGTGGGGGEVPQSVLNDIKNLKTTTGEHEVSINKNKSDIDSEKTRLDTLTTKVSENTTEIGKNKSNIEILQNRSSVSEERLTEVEREIEESKTAISNNTTAIGKNDTAISEINKTLGEHNTSILENDSNIRENYFEIQEVKGDVEELPNNILKKVYPVGSIYTSVVSTNPSTLFGGTWVRFAEGRTLVGVQTTDTDFNGPNKTGGSKTHILTVREMPSHSHNIKVRTDSGMEDAYETGGYHEGRFQDTGLIQETGGGQPHNNLQPYITVYFWRRTA